MQEEFKQYWISERRKALGFTQTTLAVRAEISLPTLQNIESGKANPSWDVLVKLMKALECSIIFQKKDLNWTILSSLGAPIMTTQSAKVTNNKTAIVELKKAFYDLTVDSASLNERERESLLAYAMALRDHYPSIFKKFQATMTTSWLDKEIKKNDLGRLIKLRRIALANIKASVFDDL